MYFLWSKTNHKNNRPQVIILFTFKAHVCFMPNTLQPNLQSKALNIEDRFKNGKALRVKHPRMSLGEFSPLRNRPDPISILETQSETRLQALVPIRYARMLQSPFAFFRGAAAIMASDFADSQTTGIAVQNCGDAHIANFGVFASAERQIIFGINDFDETLPGPWEWDLKRLVASMVIGGRYLGATESLCQTAVFEAVKHYRKRMTTYASMGFLELHYDSLNERNILNHWTTMPEKEPCASSGKPKNAHTCRCWVNSPIWLMTAIG